ncbi:hypothetical protein [Rhodococcus sp. NBC_00294]|uniref:hypothetical protein n=1 Tax=Rhodococcus sp. NBC_00294 TaxID=2976004 RepID=UPI002E2B616F|nr:hypothetical protein [Rhodococcus sp. NBC_00294]
MDAYDYKARLAPVTVMAVPALALGAALFGLGAWRAGLGLLIGVSGLHFLLMQFVRDRGFAQQDRLFKKWGGSPTMQLLRWTSGTNRVLTAHRHHEVSRATGIALPSAADETSDLDAATHTYETAITVLRDRTRADGFGLIMRHNATYGFRRNLYGCRPIGITVAVVTACLGGALIAFPVFDSATTNQSWIVAVLVLSILWILMWSSAITETFVRRAADQYANSLIEAAGRLEAA